MNVKAKFSEKFEQMAEAATRGVGSSWAFLLACGFVIGWLVRGIAVGFDDMWDLVMNNITAIVTFLIVFLIQQSQNKDSLAIQLKLDEIILALDKANNQLVDAENLPEKKLRHMHGEYSKRVEAQTPKNKNRKTTSSS
ncbi:low affinity iron permease family protein [Runella zeae]|jgi:low affinity Fe/Cu permease|uniref:low affinity iron permease family protein n=1 Tax=Runella zeae TaxID=94255 RepID=UPI0005695E59|nr:low affinity iron permease family protein [Runella zeae]